MAYERVLLETASKKVRERLVEAANTMLPIFAKHVLWRPKRAGDDRAPDGEPRPRAPAVSELQHGVRLANSLGLDVSRRPAPGRLIGPGPEGRATKLVA